MKVTLQVINVNLIITIDQIEVGRCESNLSGILLLSVVSGSSFLSCYK